MLITDYSSVFFDFAYMKKPIVYYQFDEDDFHSWHYHKGYFDYRTMGFGDVCMKEAEVLESLCDVFYNNMQPSPEYLKRMDAFFPLHDTNNCQRIFDRIVKAGNEK